MKVIEDVTNLLMLHWFNSVKESQTLSSKMQNYLDYSIIQVCLYPQWQKITIPAFSQGAEKRCEFQGQIQQFLVAHGEKETNSCCSNGKGQAEWGVISDDQVIFEWACL